MHHKISFCYTNVVENDSALNVGTLIGGEHGDKLPEEPMCEAKMDPETAGSDRIADGGNNKSPICNTTTTTTTLPCDGGGGGGGGINKNNNNGKHKITTMVNNKAPLTPVSQGDEEDEDMLSEASEEEEDEDEEEDDLISVGGSPSPSPSLLTSPDTFSRNSQHHGDDCCGGEGRGGGGGGGGNGEEEEYFKPLKKLRMLKVESPSQGPIPGVRSFSITDILSHKPAVPSTPTSTPPTLKSNHSHHHHNNSSSHHSSSNASKDNHHHHHHHQTGRNNSSNSSSNNTEVVIQQRIVRPWDATNKSNGRRNSSDSSPLDALFQMTSKTFEGLNGHHDNSDHGRGGSDHQMFSGRQPPKKKRKSRTAFTNHQIFELEKRFLYQKYLSPADRDDIAQQLGLTNAQVITWFQNRRAKLKRDMEELKKDVESAKLLSAHKSFLESAHDLGLLKKRPQSQMDLNAATVASYHIASSPTSSSQSHSPINLTSESPPSTH